MFALAANLSYFQIPDFQFLKGKKKIINKHIAHPPTLAQIALYIWIKFGNPCGYAFTMNDNEKVQKFYLH